jgi:hypothetical protein
MKTIAFRKRGWGKSWTWEADNGHQYHLQVGGGLVVYTKIKFGTVESLKFAGRSVLRYGLLLSESETDIVMEPVSKQVAEQRLGKKIEVN